MLVACRDMTLNGQRVVVGQVVDTLWPTLRPRTQKLLLEQRRVQEVETVADAKPPGLQIHRGGLWMGDTAEDPAPKKRGRKPKPAAQA